MSPLVSVVLPTYNRAALVGDAIASVLEQSFADLELIVVDDGSNDDTEATVKRIDDPRITFVRVKRQGAAAARNRGIERARGELVAFQDSDDRWLPGKLEEQIAALAQQDPRVGVVYGRAVCTLGSTILETPSPAEPVVSGDLSTVLPRYNLIDTPTALVRSSVLRSVGGFDPAMPRFQDWDLWLTLAPTCRFHCIDRAVVASGVTPGSITSQGSSYFESIERILSKHAALFELVPEALVQYHLQLALHEAKGRHPGAAARHAVVAGRTAPLRTFRSLVRRGLGRPPAIHNTRPTRSDGAGRRT